MKNKEIILKINRRKLFSIIAVSFLLLIAYILGFFGKQDQLNEKSLGNNYNQLLNFEDNNEWGEIYDNFILPNLKIKVNREKFIEIRNKARDKEEFVKRDIEVHGVVIRDNLGFIDRTSKKCLDEECIQYKTERIYKKWAFIDGHWYTSGETTCIRKEPYTMPSEFERAISLIKQRFDQADIRFIDARGDSYDDDIYNCINIQYADLKSKGEGPEGVFYFDSQISKIDNLELNVDYSYQSKDDLLTAILLVHELTHAVQYLDKLVYNEGVSCIDKETFAFRNELSFIATLNPEEVNSLNSRLQTYVITGRSSSFSSISELAKIQTESLYQCNSSNLDQNDCFWETVEEKIEGMVVNNPYYQEQCRL